MANTKQLSGSEQNKVLPLCGVSSKCICKGTGVIKDTENGDVYCDCEIGDNLMYAEYCY